MCVRVRVRACLRCFSPPLDGQLLVGRLLHVYDNFLVHAGSQLEALLVLVFGNSTMYKKMTKVSRQMIMFLFFV